MRNPFPGMNPWLESSWGDLHHRIIQYSCDQLAEQLPGELFSLVEETVYVFDRGADHGRVRPDVGVFDAGDRPDRRERAGKGGAAVVEPVRIRIEEEPIIEGRIEIRRLGGGEPLVTVIEVMSPTNKLDRRGRRAYVQKREAYYDAGANVVEIDLLRDGEPLIDVPLEALTDAQRTAYKACVRRAVAAEVPIEAEYYPLPLNQRLPRIAIPLRRTDEDIVLDLQQPIDLAYERGRYAIHLDYSKAPKPPLTTEDAAWAREVVKSQISKDG